MRDQGDFKSGVKRFAYDGGKSTKSNSASDEWDSFGITKPVKEIKELDELNNIWSIQKNVSLNGSPLKPQGTTVQAAPTGTGFYSRHGQHNSLKMSEGTRSSPSLNTAAQPRSSFSMNPQRSGYSYSQPDSGTTATTFPLLSSTSGGSNYQSQSRYNDATHPASNQRHLPGTTVMNTRTSSIGMQKPNQHYSADSQQPGGNSNRSSRTGNHWPSF
ncbi:uncharacterized protein LOC110974562 [Acanthaster planci]|uniref:Uncharacterized protein LOC110974562 n=1 Tax=Acanthaster planci TaxID=133434 RepID=A0A8B7XPL4_ACAPL|nr:uncharacterized protein LOC110974562 [Acanthaster planci]